MTKGVTKWYIPDISFMFKSAQGGVNMTNTILRLPAVLKRTGLSRSTVYLLISKDKFPESISLGDRAVGWIESEIDQWLEERISASRSDQ
jgi:prophage regulatory protein